MNQDTIFTAIHENHELHKNDYEAEPQEEIQDGFWSEIIEDEERRPAVYPGLGLIFRWLLAAGFVAATEMELMDPILGACLAAACGIWGTCYWIRSRRAR